MKKFLIIFALFCLCSSLFGCANAQKEDKLSVVCTVFPQYDFSKEITRDTKVSVKMLLSPGSDPHSYEPTPADIIAAAECDLFICLGGESEAWADKIIAAASIDEGRIIRLMDIVAPEEEHEHSHGEDEHDRHVWTAPENAILISEAIFSALSAISPDDSLKFSENLASYKNQLMALHEDFLALSEMIEGKTVIFGDSFPFKHMTDAYGIAYASPYNGCGAHSEASAADVAAVIDIARAEGAGVVFAVDFSNGNLAETIANEIGGRVMRLYSCHTLSAELMGNGESYISVMRKNLQNLKEAFDLNG